MARSVQWRRNVSDACNWHQTQALEATIYLLRQTGPTGFLLKEEGESKTVKVYLGDQHTCTCPVFKKERDLCKHICWLLLRKFRLSQNDPLSWQLGLVEREVNEILQGRNTAQQRPSQARQTAPANTSEESSDGRRLVQQRVISDDDVCPICQDELLTKKLPVTYCRYGCGNNIHIKCMTVWAEHQQKTSHDKSIKCPMCREDFGSIEALKTESRNAGVQKRAPPGVRLDRHIGLACGHCSKAPIEGKCYKCTSCSHFYMCQRCFNLPVHTQHSFQFRQKLNQRWRSATRTLGASLPPAIVNDLMNRDISEDDYDSLLMLDRNTDGDLSTLTEEALHQLPMERVRERSSLLLPGAQCRVCLRGFTTGQYVRRLPCNHKFHKDCIDSWLLHSHSTCPIDGLVAIQHEQRRNSIDQTSAQRTVPPSENSLEVSANGLTINAMGIPMAISRLNSNSEGTAPTLRRPPRVPLNALPTTTQNMELSGTRLSGGDNMDIQLINSGNNIGQTDIAEDNNDIPGYRLLQQARLHRQRIANHLNHMNEQGNNSNLDQNGITLGDFIQYRPPSGRNAHSESGRNICDENSFRHNSAGSVSSIGSGARRNQGRQESLFTGSIRERASSAERPTAIPSIQAATQTMRDLYLGNDPSVQPPVSGGVVWSSVSTPTRRKHRGRLHTGYTPSRSNQRPRNGAVPGPENAMHANNRDIQLEGFAIDTIQDTI